MSGSRSSVLRSLLLSSVALIGISGPCLAADLGPMFKAPPPAAAPLPWYLQVETGGAIFNDPTNVNPGSIYGCPPTNCSTPPGFWTETLFGGGGPIVGARLGLQITQIFRADVSVQYMTHTLTGNFDWNQSGRFSSCNPSTNPGNCSLNAIRKASALVELVNGYIDLDGIIGPRFGRWHPYVTGGIGASQNFLGQNCVSCDYGTRNGSNTSNQFAWVVGAGARIDLFSDLRLDLAYRYYDLGTFTGGNNGNTGGLSFGRCSGCGFTGSDSFHQTVNVFTIGVAYPF